MAMSRKHYIAFAQTISEQVEAAKQVPAHGGQRKAALAAVVATAEELARNLKADNSSFDRARFLRACGIEE